MKFPGNNVVKLTEAAVRELLKAHAPTLFGDPEARITKIETNGYDNCLEIHYTTDPDPALALAESRN